RTPQHGGTDRERHRQAPHLGRLVEVRGGEVLGGVGRGALGSGPFIRGVALGVAPLRVNCAPASAPTGSPPVASPHLTVPFHALFFRAESPHYVRCPVTLPQLQAVAVPSAWSRPIGHRG